MFPFMAWIILFDDKIEKFQNGFIKVSRSINSIPNIVYRDFISLKLGFYPFIATIGRSVENYLNTPRK